VVDDSTDLSCRVNHTPALAEMSLNIAPGEKVALCGPSGSGKTTLIMALLRMVELSEGKIMMDDIDISMVQGDEVRSRLNVVPQEPFFMPGTVRFNLDPHKRAGDESIEKAIRLVGLWKRIIAGEGQNSESAGLDRELVASDWSQGERQLLCLARALLVPSRLVILDEAASRYNISSPPRLIHAFPRLPSIQPYILANWLTFLY
jgi:ATP-binding cassette subfamily C (CFTR/MRP) protein 1